MAANPLGTGTGVPGSAPAAKMDGPLPTCSTRNPGNPVEKSPGEQKTGTPQQRIGSNGNVPGGGLMPFSAPDTAAGTPVGIPAPRPFKLG